MWSIDWPSEWPRIAMIAGSGIAQAIPQESIQSVVPMDSQPGLPPIHVAGHRAEFARTRVQRAESATPQTVDILVAMGRTHLYEGRSVPDVVAVVRWLALQGCSHLILTNAAGGLHPSLQVGNLLCASDVWNATGRHVASPSHPLRQPVLDPEWRARTLTQCANEGVRLLQGTYISVLGPSYETRAEIRMYRKMGADVIGMSTALEAETAATLGMKVLSLSLVTNVLSDAVQRHLNHDEVLAAGSAGAASLWQAVTAAVRAVDVMPTYPA